MHIFAEQTKKDLVEWIEKIADNQPNRIAVLTLTKMVSDQERAKILFESLQTEDFLDSEREGEDEREDRYAWDCTLYALNNWALLAMQPWKRGANHTVEERREHLIACALHSDFKRDMRRAHEAYINYDADMASDALATLVSQLKSHRKAKTSNATRADQALYEALDRYLEVTP